MRNYFGFVLFIFVMVLNLVAVAVLPNNIFDTTNSLQYIDTNFACVCVCMMNSFTGMVDFLPQPPCSCVYSQVVLSHVYRPSCVPLVTDMKKPLATLL